MDEIDRVIKKYCIFFPELKEEYVNNDDDTIINIICEDLIERGSNNSIVDVSEMKKIIRKKIKK